MRLAYLPDPPPNLSAEDKQVYERIKARRGDDGMIPLDFVLLHAPKVADGWNALLGAIRTKTSLPDDIREIAICRPALLNRAWIEWNAHEILLRESNGITEEKVSVVRQFSPENQGTLNDRQWAVLRYADSMTRNVEVPESIIEELKSNGFNDQEIVEITATVGAYNLVTRFMVALDVSEGNRNPPTWVQ
ncbi:AhpD-like protein [Bisporella sp. PMI_857]|nr:AhpD-like protein [Bisporella sp. PMI_857]